MKTIATKTISNKMRLQGIGQVVGTPAIQIKLHDTLMWNNGSTTEVMNITPSKTGKTLVIAEKWFDEWKKEYKTTDRKMTASRLVCIVKDGKYTLIA